MTCLRGYVAENTYKILIEATKKSENLLINSRKIIEIFLIEEDLKSDAFCFVAVGSIGRYEALDASDFDLVPIVLEQESYDKYQGLDNKLRKILSSELELKVSQGKELTKPVLLDDLSSPDNIGGEDDSREKLTQRILILTESAHAGGGIMLNSIMNNILHAYATHERTSGRHPLAFCNDVARYYRQVCIDYKFKVDAKDLDWCTRNIKLRHSRKFWYFATLLAISAITRNTRSDHGEFSDEILVILAKPPIIRLLDAATSYRRHAVGRSLDHYAIYLEFMSEPSRRKALSKIKFDRRYDAQINNPYPRMQSNSKLMHIELLRLLDFMERDIQERVLAWFLL